MLKAPILCIFVAKTHEIARKQSEHLLILTSQWLQSALDEHTYKRIRLFAEVGRPVVMALLIVPAALLCSYMLMPRNDQRSSDLSLQEGIHCLVFVLHPRPPVHPAHAFRLSPADKRQSDLSQQGKLKHRGRFTWSPQRNVTVTQNGAEVAA